MSKKDYVLIAGVLYASYSMAPEDAQTVVYATALNMAHALKRENPRFDTDKFLTYVREGK